MVFSYFLWVEFDRSPPNHSISKVSNHIPVYLITKILYCASHSLYNNRLFVIGVFSFRLGINSNQIEVFPHSINQFIQVPPQVTSNWNIMLNLVQDVQLIEGYSVDFVQCIQARDILTVSLDYIDYVVLGGITFDQDVSIVDSVLFQNGFDCLVIHPVGLYHSRNSYSTFIFSFKIDFWRSFVQPNTKTLQLVLDYLFVLHWSGCVQNNHNQVACSSYSDDLTTSTLAVFGAFDNTRQIQELYLGSFVLQNSRNAS